ncbi:efflux RND transporter periplasmic adaptor subunit [Vitiosangium sp. GDMCC 1.1324]|uniref:efflux RND transporter periplasmic adaptor subunit n=1 Tax=Vitiosangium sp. (strain GDMCC 1.1324) TaxID=2138576 RepID=UPI000D3613A1|nr:efflux RND transporter periplasmic adaptor subunit [Vitiosangium sp. GDMCC 1.1324]PTL77627.1 efflux RND transporter periplasmic adaptor subunit [Vitiosangium sp. GDMCC 1.1324]
MTDSSSRFPRRPLWFTAAGLGLGAAVTLGLVLGRPTPAEAEGTATVDPIVRDESVHLPLDGPQWQYIELAVAAEAPALAPLPAPGRVDLDEHRTSAVGSPLAGRVDQVRVRIGDRVKAGDRLFSVRSGAYADLDRELKSTESDVTTRQKLVDRLRELVGLQAAPEKDLLAAEAELRQAKLALEAAKAKRSSLSVSAEGDNLFWVTAPRSGTVVDQNVTTSQEVTPDRDAPLLRISDLGEVVVQADVQEADASDLQEGQEVTVTTQGGSVKRQGKVERVSEVVDPQRRTVVVRVRVANEDRALRPNAFVEVTPAPPADEKRVRVPAGAVITNGERSVVFVTHEAGRLERVPVTVGRRRDGEVEVRAGLDVGSRYVARGALLLENTIELAD